jgi:hypothetical protein
VCVVIGVVAWALWCSWHRLYNTLIKLQQLLLHIILSTCASSTAILSNKLSMVNSCSLITPIGISDTGIHCTAWMWCTGVTYFIATEVNWWEVWEAQKNQNILYHKAAMSSCKELHGSEPSQQESSCNPNELQKCKQLSDLPDHSLL